MSDLLPVSGSPARAAPVRVLLICAAVVASLAFASPAAGDGSGPKRPVVQETDLLADALSADAGASAAGSVAQAQTAWTQYPAIDSYASPAIATIGHTQGLPSQYIGQIYTVAVAYSEHSYYTSRNSSMTGTPADWEAWQSIGPAHQCSDPPFCTDDPAFHFDPYTAPILLRDENRLWLFARGDDDNLYETDRGEGGGWSAWQQLTTDASVQGRFSVALTHYGGTRFVHAVYSAANSTVEYRRFGVGWSQSGATERWANAVEGTIGTDGSREVWAAVRMSSSVLIERKSTPWNVPWQPVLTLNAGPGSEYFDVSSIVYFGGAYQVAYSYKYGCGDGAFCYSLAHSRFRPGVPDDGYVRWVLDYTPQGYGHPQADLTVYRNKLVMAYRDHVGWVRYAYWDNADPSGPWVGREIVASGATSHRPALGVVEQCQDLRSAECIVANFGDDLLAAANSYSDDSLYFINFSRAFFMQRLAQIDIAVRWCTEYVKPPGGQDMVKCPTLSNPPAISELPVYTEVGYATLNLPNWLMSVAIWRLQESAGQTVPHTTWTHTEDIGTPYVGPNINIDRKMNYFQWWEEGGHVLAGALGLCDAPCESATPNLISDLIPNAARDAAFTLFAESINADCFPNDPSDTCPETRVRGFTGLANNYDVATRQHSFLYPLLLHHDNGDQLRQWAQEDVDNGVDLLRRKYNWIKQYVFKDVEFESKSVPLAPLANDSFASATNVPQLAFASAQNARGATSEFMEPSPSCAAMTNSVWYSYTPGTTQDIKAFTAGSDYDSQLAVWQGITLGSLTEIGCNDDTGGTLQSEVRFTAQAGQTYYFQVDGYSGAEGNLVFTFKLQNDDFAQATAISGLRYTNVQNTTGASKETGQPPERLAACLGTPVEHSVWYTYSPSITQGLRAETAGSGYDTELAVWLGTSPGNLTEIGCNDDTGGTLQSAVDFTATAGQVYYFQIDGFGSASGNLHFTLKLGNDDIAQATAVTGVPFSRNQNTTGATTELGEPLASCLSTPSEDSVWYSFQPSVFQNVVVQTFGSNYDTELAVWVGSPVSEVACNDDADGTLQSRVGFTAFLGATYWIQIDGYNFAQGALQLDVRPDADADGIGEPADNCPSVANPGQENTDAFLAANGAGQGSGNPPPPLPADALGDACDTDDDNDGFTDTVELAISTNPLDNCPAASGPGTNGDSWPLDNAVNGIANVLDLLSYKGKTPDAVPPQPKRLDLDDNNVLNVFDVLMFKGKVPTTCT